MVCRQPSFVQCAADKVPPDNPKDEKYSNATLTTIMVKGIEIERVKCYKYLGLIIYEHLFWNEHIESVKNKVGPFLAMLRNAAYFLPNEIKLSVYYAHIDCHLTYMNTIWGAALDNRMNDLRLIQNKAIKYVYWDEYRQSSTSMNRVLRVVDTVYSSSSSFSISSTILSSNTY